MASLEPEGGYNYKFVSEPPDSLKCLICLSVVKEPQQHAGCGKLFCKVCIDHYKLQLRNDCPHCRQPLNDLFADLRSEQEIKSLLVRCNNTASCGWEGELRLAEDHIQKDCPNTLIPCPRGCNNLTTKILRKNIEIHMQRCPKRPYLCIKCDQKIEFRMRKNHETSQCPKRQYACPNCNKAGVYDEITTTHPIVCPNKIISCQKCSRPLLLSDESKHLAICQYVPVCCKYHKIGCGEKPLRRDLIKHEEDAQLHLSLATDRIIKLTNMLVLKNTLTFKITSFADHKCFNKHVVKSGIRTSQKGYEMSVRVDANGLDIGQGTHVSVYAHLMKGDHDDTLTWPFTGSVTVELLNQLEDKNHHKETIPFQADNEISKRVVDGERGEGWGRPGFIPHAALDYNASTNTQYLKDDTLVFRVSAEAPDHKPWLECTD